MYCMEAIAPTLNQTFTMGPRGPTNLPGAGGQQQQQQQASSQGPCGGVPPRPQEPQEAAQGPQDPPPPPPPPQQTSQGTCGGGQRAQDAPPPPPHQHHYRPPQHHKPFFYVQPSQPYIPLHNLQWPVAMPMPMPYNPMVPCGYPGLGYGMQMMPPYQPGPYLEPPGYVLPQTHLHLMDYRRMLNPHHYQTMAYHSRRLRYQHNGSAAREMTSSEVQTEPLTPAPHRSNNNNSPAAAKAPDRPPADEKTAASSQAAAACRPPSPPAMAVKDKTCLADQRCSATRVAAAPAAKSSFVIQTEEVTIECCSTPMGLNILTSPETSVQQYSHRNVVQCSSSTIATIREDRGVPEEGDPMVEHQDLQACPEVLLVAPPPPTELPALEQPKSQTTEFPASSALDGTLLPVRDDDDHSRTDETTTGLFKVVHLPFDNTKDFKERQKMDSNLWSFEVSCSTPSLLDHSFFTSLDHPYMLTPEDSSFAPAREEPRPHVLPCLEDSRVPCLDDPRFPSPIVAAACLEDSCVPSLDLDFPPCVPQTSDTGGVPSLDETSCIPSSEWLNHTCLEAPVEVPASITEVPLAEEPAARNDVTVEEEPATQIEISPPNKDPGMEVGASAGDLLVEIDQEITTVPVTEEVPTATDVGLAAEMTLAPDSLWMDNQPIADVSQQQQRMELDNQDHHQESSFESLPAYLPSTHVLADFDHYDDNALQTPQKLCKTPSGGGSSGGSRGRKPDLDVEERQAVAFKPTKGEPPTKGAVDRRSLSDHECFLKRKFDGNAVVSTPCAYRDPICARCLAKHRLRLSAGPNGARPSKRNALHFQALDDAALPTCDACRSHTKKRPARRVSGASVPSGSCRRTDEDTEGETSENSYHHYHHLTGPKRRGVVDHKRPLSCRPHFETCPVALYPQLGEKNCVCEELLQQHPTAAAFFGEAPRGRRAHSNAMREINRENLAVPAGTQKDPRRNVHPHYTAHKRPTERSWNTTEVILDTEGRKNAVRSQHLIKHRISLSQGIHGTDTRQ